VAAVVVVPEVSELVSVVVVAVAVVKVVVAGGPHWHSFA
jgi:hypothetical protein